MVAATNKEIEAKKQHREELKEVKKGLLEAIGKEMKACEKKNLEQIKKYHAKNPNDQVVSFVLNELTRFISGKQTATFAEANQGIFDSVEVFYEMIRSINPTALPYDNAKDVMIKIGGTDGNQGEIINQLTDPKMQKTYLPFFAFFKTLSKIVHWSMNAMKD